MHGQTPPGACKPYFSVGLIAVLSIALLFSRFRRLKNWVCANYMAPSNNDIDSKELAAYSGCNPSNFDCLDIGEIAFCFDSLFRQRV
jgi:hypothetical protein